MLRVGAASLLTGVNFREGNGNILVQGVTAGKGTAIPVQAWIGTEGSRRLRLPGIGRLYPTGNIPCTHLCKMLSRPHSTAGRIMSVKNF